MRLLIRFTIFACLLAACILPAQTMQRWADFQATDFPGGRVSLLDNKQFVWTASDVSGIVPGQTVRAVRIQTIINSSNPDAAAAFLSLYTTDSRYYLVPLPPEAMRALAKGLEHAGLDEGERWKLK